MSPLPPRSRHALPALRRFPLALSLLVAASSHLARAEIQFVGILATRDLTRFALTDTTTGKTEWIVSKGRFAGYTIGAFDPQADTLILSRDGNEMKLRLVADAKIKDARLELTGAVTIGTDETFEVLRATLRYDEENVFPLKDGVIYKITPTRREDGTIRYSIAVERVHSATKVERISAPNVIANPSQAIKLRIDDYGFAFSPR